MTTTFNLFEDRINQICAKAGLTPEEVEPLAVGKSFEEFSEAVDKLIKEKYKESLKNDPNKLGDHLYRQALTKWTKDNENLLRANDKKLVVVSLEKGLLVSFDCSTLEKLNEDLINRDNELIEVDRINRTAKFIVNVVNDQLLYKLLAYPVCTVDSNDQSNFVYTSKIEDDFRNGKIEIGIEEIITQDGEELELALSQLRDRIVDKTNFR